MGMRTYYYVGPYAVVKPTIETLITEELEDQLTETLTYFISGKDICWFPNRYDSQPPHQIHFSTEDEEAHYPMQDHIDSCRCWFSVTYKDELDILLQHYGNLKYEWGVIVYIL